MMRHRIMRCRLFSARTLVIFLIVAAFGAYCYYYTNTSSLKNRSNDSVELKSLSAIFYKSLRESKVLPPETCPLLEPSTADIDTVSVYPHFDFQPSWLRTKEFWDKSFEDRYERCRNDSRRPRLKVIVVPHSHNDPGWLKTFEEYFELKTRNILDNVVQKLNQYPKMTFIWTEISFLNAWWERAHPIKQKALKKLIKEKRLEITTGGWVMPDEACTHIYALIDQFIEGHQWLKNNLGISPKIGWSIDPFGHGPTVPYLLDKSGLEGAIIQRIHYAWKQWLAKEQIEEFYWMTGWTRAKPSLIVHNQPFDIYSIKSTCGPHPSVCLSFDFRMIPGEYSEYTAKHEEITDENLHSKSKTLIEEYERIGSLTPHNVVLVPLGDDFRYEYPVEFDAQYSNYMRMFDYINSNREHFNADVQFGTPLDYFNAMKERHHNIPTLKGDFFVYSDIFSDGKPAYWSGYYTTRPYLKVLARQFEHQLRTSEILFTLVSNYIKQSRDPRLLASEKKLEKSYEQLINARRNLGVFQHHDAITGTSKATVMHDYGTKMFTSLYHCLRLQETALATVLLPGAGHHAQGLLQSDIEWEIYGKQVRKIEVTLTDHNKVVVFNSLAEERLEVITLRTNNSNIRVLDTRTKEYVQYQISPNIDIRDDGRRVISGSTFDVLFVANLPPLTSVTYSLEEHANTTNRCVVFCNNCVNEKSNDIFVVREMMPGDIQLENSMLKLLINRNTGFLKQIYQKDVKKKHFVNIQFGAYESAQRHSGAYLFMPNYDSPERQVLQPYANWENLEDDNIVIASGPVCTDITVMYAPFLVHTLRIYHVDDDQLSRAVLVENVVDFGAPPKNRETELFMRIHTDIQNEDIPVFYTDQNGFQYQKRVKVPNLGIEANYYPMTTMAWIQDERTRLSLLTAHTQGAAAFEPGRLEVMLDRRTLYDDFRGIGEGIVDNKPTVFHNWLLLESIDPPRVKPEASTRKNNHRVFEPTQMETEYELPSSTANFLSRSLNYPANVYLVDSGLAGTAEVAAQRRFAAGFPRGLHLLTLRTITDDLLDQIPSSSCFMVLHRPGYTCATNNTQHLPTKFTPQAAFDGLKITNITRVSLTGLDDLEQLPGLEAIHVQPMDVETYKVWF